MEQNAKRAIPPPYVRLETVLAICKDGIVGLTSTTALYWKTGQWCRSIGFQQIAGHGPWARGNVLSL